MPGITRRDTDAQPVPMIASYGHIGRRASQRVYGKDTLMYYAYDGTFNQPDDFGVRQVAGTTHTFNSGGPNETVFDGRTYTWDRVFNKTQRADVRAAGPGLRLTHDYEYAPAYRLTHTTASDTVGETAFIVRETAYNLDGVHNRLSTSGTVGGDVDETTGDYTMDPAGGPDQAMNQYTTTPLDQRSYDANGNLTGILGTDAAGNARNVSCLYDYRNRLVEYMDSETNIRNTYVYDPLGRRIAKTVDADGVDGGPTTTHYIYGGESQWQVVVERGGASNRITATYVYGNYIDEVLQMQRCPAGQTCGTGNPPVDYYYHTDDLYNVMVVTDANGDVVERCEYDDYGRPLYFLSPDGTAHTSSTIANPYLFTGRRYDDETGWYNYRTRYLDPFSGRFTGRDIIGIWGDPWEFGNGNTYVENSPASWLDPWGLLKRDKHGHLIVSKTGEKHRVPLGGIVEVVVLKADDGTPIKAFELLRGYPGFKTDCHGVTFADGKYWIDNEEVKKILKGDHYKKINPTGDCPAKVGDVLVYRDKDNVVHSVRVTKVDRKTGKPTEVEGLGGTEIKTKKTTPESGWGWDTGKQGPNGEPLYTPMQDRHMDLYRQGGQPTSLPTKKTK